MTVVTEFFLQIAVAAAIGVGGDGMSEASLRNNVMAQRIRNKMGPRVPNIPRRGQTAVMGEINKSIEKMSIGEMGNGKGMKQSRQPSGPPQTTALMQPNRRDSNWTVSTEGYGSMRSNTSTSRRCSELSQVKLSPLFASPSWTISLLHPSLKPSSSRCQLCPDDKQCSPLAGTRSPLGAAGGAVRRAGRG